MGDGFRGNEIALLRADCVTRLNPKLTNYILEAPGEVPTHTATVILEKGTH